MINDAHNRLHGYDRKITHQKTLFLEATDQDWTADLERAIDISQQTIRAKKRQILQEKLAKLTHQNDDNRADIWIGNLSDWKLTDTEKAVLIRGLNYNHRDADKTEFLAALEATLKTNGIHEETQQAIRQTVILTLTRKNIPLARESLAMLLKQDPSDTISTDNMLKLLDLRLTTHFTFNGFTREEEKNKQLPFLDVMVERRTNGEFL
eukprot:g24138.t1